MEENNFNWGFSKIKEKRDNPFYPDLITEIRWGNGEYVVVEENRGGIRPTILYRVLKDHEELGTFYQDFSKSLKEQIWGVIAGNS